jgi:hypothetical protein
VHQIKLTLLISFISTLCMSQAIGINETGESPDKSAILDIKTEKYGLIPKSKS